MQHNRPTGVGSGIDQPQPALGLLMFDLTRPARHSALPAAASQRPLSARQHLHRGGMLSANHSVCVSCFSFRGSALNGLLIMCSVPSVRPSVRALTPTVHCRLRLPSNYLMISYIARLDSMSSEIIINLSL